MYNCFAPRCRFRTEDRAAFADHTRKAHGEPPLGEVQLTDCVFHGHVYPEHDFTYGNECRRCGGRVSVKVYVCMVRPGYGMSDYVVRVVSTEDAAKAWVSGMPRDREYEEFKVDSE